MTWLPRMAPRRVALVAWLPRAVTACAKAPLLGAKMVRVFESWMGWRRLVVLRASVRPVSLAAVTRSTTLGGGMRTWSITWMISCMIQAQHRERGRSDGVGRTFLKVVEAWTVTLLAWLRISTVVVLPDFIAVATTTAPPPTVVTDESLRRVVTMVWAGLTANAEALSEPRPTW